MLFHKFLGAACGPENERESREEEDKADDKCREVAATWEAMLSIVVGVKETLFFDRVELVLPGPPRALTVGGAALARAREASGGGLAGVTAQGGVGVGVRRGTQRALERAGVE
ncbi:hypothetical protein CR513_15709, partial [Mucuna pruriens]